MRVRGASAESQRTMAEGDVGMAWVKGIIGGVLVLLGAVWIGQGVGLLPGSFMTGQLQWAIVGLVLLAIGVWLVWSVVQARRSAGARAG